MSIIMPKFPLNSRLITLLPGIIFLFLVEIITEYMIPQSGRKACRIRYAVLCSLRATRLESDVSGSQCVDCRLIAWEMSGGVAADYCTVGGKAARTI